MKSHVLCGTKFKRRNLLLHEIGLEQVSNYGTIGHRKCFPKKKKDNC
jgi:hypothetical protein